MHSPAVGTAAGRRGWPERGWRNRAVPCGGEAGTATRDREEASAPRRGPANCAPPAAHSPSLDSVLSEGTSRPAVKAAHKIITHFSMAGPRRAAPSRRQLGLVAAECEEGRAGRGGMSCPTGDARPSVTLSADVAINRTRDAPRPHIPPCTSSLSSHPHNDLGACQAMLGAAALFQGCIPHVSVPSNAPASSVDHPACACKLPVLAACPRCSLPFSN